MGSFSKIEMTSEIPRLLGRIVKSYPCISIQCMYAINSIIIKRITSTSIVYTLMHLQPVCCVGEFYIVNLGFFPKKDIMSWSCIRQTVEQRRYAKNIYRWWYILYTTIYTIYYIQQAAENYNLPAFINISWNFQLYLM